jgi:hypothetical protein
MSQFPAGRKSGAYRHQGIRLVPQRRRLPRRDDSAPAVRPGARNSGTIAQVGVTGQGQVITIRCGGTREESRIGIIGLSGLGLLEAQFAVALGAEAYAAEINTSVWPHATAAGVSGVARSITEDRAPPRALPMCEAEHRSYPAGGVSAGTGWPGSSCCS